MWFWAQKFNSILRSLKVTGSIFYLFSCLFSGVAGRTGSHVTGLDKKATSAGI